MSFRNYIVAMIGGCMGIIATSCLGTEDSDPTQQQGEGTFPTLGTVVRSPLNELEVESDTYGKLIPSTPQLFIEQKADTTGQRVLLSVRFLDSSTPPVSPEGEHKVDVSFVQKVLTKNADDLRKTGIEDVFGHSLIDITSVSISRKYLNIQYSIRGGNPPARPHRISLVLDERTKLDAEGNLYVTLRHNAEGDAEVQSYWGVVSFNLMSIPEYTDPQCKGFAIAYEGSSTPWIIRKEVNTTPRVSQPHHDLATY